MKNRITEKERKKEKKENKTENGELKIRKL
jgi:hypothetical protein